jgi:hypothetical protein
MITEKEYQKNLDMYHVVIKSLLEEKGYKVEMQEDSRDFECKISDKTFVELHGDGMFLYFVKDGEDNFLHDAFVALMKYLEADIDE